MYVLYCGRGSDAGDTEGGAGSVNGYSAAMRSYPVSGLQLRPDTHWSPVIGAYYDGSDTEDTGAGCRSFTRLCSNFTCSTCYVFVMEL